ncbi:putative GATA transcription factor 26-like isoform X2, partial [Capsicum annuum]
LYKTAQSLAENVAKFGDNKETFNWRNGPHEKPMLCNACGLRWRTRQTLDGCVPKHANGEIQSSQLPSEIKPARDDQKLEVGVEVSGQHGSSACLEEEMNNISAIGSAGSASDNCIQMEETNETSNWRNGPPEKPVFCNACELRWRTRQTLDGYIPKHANGEIQSSQLPFEMKPARDDQKLEVGVKVSGQEALQLVLKRR